MTHEVNSKGHRPGKHRRAIRGIKHGFYVSGSGSADRIVFSGLHNAKSVPRSWSDAVAFCRPFPLPCP